MGIFTSYASTLVDDHITFRTKLITQVILKNVPYINSILLTGGFGKGEGSIKIENNEVICLRDFDIAVIVDRIPNKRTIENIYDQIYQSLNLTNPENKIFRFFNFVVDIKFLRKKDLIYNDIWFYDLKVASKLLYGEDIRQSISSSKKEIPLSSGLRILFEKVTGLLFHVDCMEEKKPPKEKKELLIFECYKTFIEICTSLCILANRYEPKYADRAKIFEKLYFIKFPQLAKVLPDLPKRVTACTNFKLKPDFTKVKEDPVDLWFTTREYLEVILQFYIKRYLRITSLDWKDLSDYTKNLAWHYYKSFLNSLLCAKLGYSNSILLDFASFFYQALTNTEYLYVVAFNTGSLNLRLLQRGFISPSLKFFSAGTQILFSLNKDGTIEKELFQKAVEELRNCIQVETSTFDSIGWNIQRRHFMKAYSLYRGYHFVK